jgi:GAF domain-containing protein/AmiR/NasT family two-component response regulator
MTDRPIRVLIVDDEESLRAPLARWLAEEYGYAVEIAADGRQAFDLLEAQQCFDVFLLDYALPPPYNGLELMKEIRRRCRERPMDFIIFTGWGLEPQVGVEALKAGAYRYLAKPFDREELAILIRSIVEMHRTEEKLARTSREKAWLESLLEVSQSVTSTLELDKVLQLILDEMKRVVIYDSSSIQHVTDQGLEIIACRGFSDTSRVLGRIFPLSDEYPNYRVWKDRKPLIDPEMRTGRQSQRLHGWMGIPLIYRDRAIGVIALDAKTSGFYSEDDARVAMIFANQAAIAIENARLFSETQRQLSELDKLHHASGMMTAKLALAQVLKEVVALASDVANSENTSLVLVDNGEDLVTSVETFGPAFHGIPPLHERARPDGTTRQVIRRGEAVQFDQVMPGERHNPYLLQVGVASYVGLPLKAKDRVVGVLFVHSRTPGAFKERVSLLTTFANQAAIAIENARLHEQTQNRADTLHRLLEVGHQISRVTERPRGVLETIAMMACHVTGADCAVIYPFLVDKGIYDRDNIASFGLSEEFSPSDKLREYGKSVAARIIQESAGNCIVADVMQDAELGSRQNPLRESPFIQREGIEAFAGIRLDFGSEPVGVLFVNFRSTHHFSQDELEIIQLFANQAAVAIWNARTYGRTSDRLERKLAELRTVSEINRLISSTLDINRVLPLILDKAIELLSVQHGVLQLIDPETGELVIPPEIPVPLEHRRLKPGEGITGKAAQEKRSIIVQDVNKPPWISMYHELWPDTHSELAVPLLIEGQCIGVLNLEHQEPGYFGDDEREVLDGLAVQAAIAIENARLYEGVKRRSGHLKAVHEASKAIASGFAVERKQVLDRIAEQAVERITGVNGSKAACSAVLLYDESDQRLCLESVYPATMLPELASRVDKMAPMARDTAPHGPISLAARSFMVGEPQRVNDARSDLRCKGLNAKTISELDVPLFDGDKIVGVLSVESDQPAAFDDEDTHALQNLAELAVIAIKNAERAEQLNRVDAVALMGAWGADVVHDVNREVGAIRRAIFLLQQRADLPDEVKDRLQDIDGYAGRLDLPELPEEVPESGQVLEFVDAPLLDEVIRAELDELQREDPTVILVLEPDCPDSRVAMHQRWLRRLLRHLVRNAMRAIPPDKETRQVIIRTCVQDATAQVQVEDSGKGVRPEIQPVLFRRPISHQNDPKDDRPGRGLLLVRFLAEQHGGQAKLLWSRPGEGACFAFYIPLAQPAESFAERSAN